jgi:phage FluMu gp28-like protein
VSGGRQATLDEFVRLCRKCGRAFGSERSLKIHLAAHERAESAVVRAWVLTVGPREVSRLIGEYSGNPEKLAEAILERYGAKLVAGYVRENFKLFKVMVDFQLGLEKAWRGEEGPPRYIS